MLNETNKAEQDKQSESKITDFSTAIKIKITERRDERQIAEPPSQAVKTKCLDCERDLIKGLCPYCNFFRLSFKRKTERATEQSE